MSTQQKPTANQTIEDILDELEKKFGSSSGQIDSASNEKKSKKTPPSLSPNMLIGTLALVLLIVGVGSAVLLGQRNQELRNRAAISPYNTCCQLNSGVFQVVADLATCSNIGGTAVDDSFCATPPNTSTPVPTNTTPPQSPTPTPVACTGSRIDLSRLDDGTAPADNLLLSNQYQATTGLSFSLQPQLATTQANRDACAQTSGPRIALVGAPRTAFQGMEDAPGVGGFPDRTYPGDRAQSPYMTDSADLQDFSCPVRISIDANFRRNDFIFDLVDVDNGESSTINAYDSAGQLVTSLSVSAPSGNMQYDGRSYPITLIGNRPIAYVDVIPNGNKNNWGVAYDNFCVYPQNTPTPSLTPSNTPTPTPTPTSTPGPVCASITMSPSNPSIGTPVTFTCGPVSGVARYEFRVRLPNGTFTDVLPSSTTSNVSQPYTIPQSGSFMGQCRICTGSASTTCQDWEN